MYSYDFLDTRTAEKETGINAAALEMNIQKESFYKETIYEEPVCRPNCEEPIYEGIQYDYR